MLTKLVGLRACCRRHPWRQEIRPPPIVTDITSSSPHLLTTTTTTTTTVSLAALPLLIFSQSLRYSSAVMADLSSARKRQRNGGSRASTAVPTTASIAPQSLFYPLTLHIVPEEGSVLSSESGADPDGEANGDSDQFDGNPEDITGDSHNEQLDDPSGAEVEPSHSPITVTVTDYDRAVARIDTLQSHLTAGMALDLKSLLAVIHTYLAAPDQGTHPLFELIASPDISNDEIVTLAKTVESGLAAFLARGGGAHNPKPDPGDTPPSEPTPATPSSSRSRVVTSGCAERDQRTCRFTGQRTGGVVAHVIPFSVRDEKAVNFWKFIAMFRGEADTAAMRSATLGAGDSTDTLRNVCWMWNSAHAAFDAGKLAVIPELEPTQIPYNPQLVSEVQILRLTFLLCSLSNIRVF